IGAARKMHLHLFISNCEGDNMAKSLFIICFSIILSGCSVKKEIVPIGGSKADGTVRMGYTYGDKFGAFEVPVVDIERANELATKKCKTWGYEGAEAFGGKTENCGMSNGFACTRMNVAIEYQCIGGKSAQY
ncbi:YecR family lipoprotein, partial [Proteus mirabilis]